MLPNLINLQLQVQNQPDRLLHILISSQLVLLLIRKIQDDGGHGGALEQKAELVVNPFSEVLVQFANSRRELFFEEGEVQGIASASSSVHLRRLWLSNLGVCVEIY